mmetsp:Transcript_5838/g.16394  ORF Transcript_5838/g.16394 Transcript_5838/m.16394 type:complete len:267 (+) Transcript_5838:495-1295(+)
MPRQETRPCRTFHRVHSHRASEANVDFPSGMECCSIENARHSWHQWQMLTLIDFSCPRHILQLARFSTIASCPSWSHHGICSVVVAIAVTLIIWARHGSKAVLNHMVQLFGCFVATSLGQFQNQTLPVVPVFENAIFRQLSILIVIVIIVTIVLLFFVAFFNLRHDGQWLHVQWLLVEFLLGQLCQILFARDFRLVPLLHLIRLDLFGNDAQQDDSYMIPQFGRPFGRIQFDFPQRRTHLVQRRVHDLFHNGRHDEMHLDIFRHAR